MKFYTITEVTEFFKEYTDVIPWLLVYPTSEAARRAVETDFQEALCARTIMGTVRGDPTLKWWEPSDDEVVVEASYSLEPDITNRYLITPVTLAEELRRVDLLE